MKISECAKSRDYGCGISKEPGYPVANTEIPELSANGIARRLVCSVFEPVAQNSLSEIAVNVWVCVVDCGEVERAATDIYGSLSS